MRAAIINSAGGYTSPARLHSGEWISPSTSPFSPNWLSIAK